MFDSEQQTFFSGTGDCHERGRGPYPVDIPAWGTLAAVLTPEQSRASLQWALENAEATDFYDGRTYHGFLFGSEGSNPQWEVHASLGSDLATPHMGRDCALHIHGILDCR